MTRTLSYSEISTALTCTARHAFAYTGWLTDGSTLSPHVTAPILREGRAWGAGVAAYHAGANLFGPASAFSALTESVNADAQEMADAGVILDPAEIVEMTDRLGAILTHYMTLSEPLSNLTRLEDEIDVPIPSRRGDRASTRYRFMCRLDGFTVDEHGHEWVVEYKLRRELTPAQLLATMPQHRWYAWARQQETGRPIVGVLVDERVNEAPRPARILKNGKPSHAVNQLTTDQSYAAACQAADVEPEPETMAAFRARRWQHVVPLMFRAGELHDAGRELVSAARLIRDLDSGALAPIRNASRMTCSGCRFREICPSPDDRLFVDSQFSRTTPKRLRDVETVAA